MEQSQDELELEILRRERDELIAKVVDMEKIVEAARHLCNHGPLGILAFTPQASLAWSLERDERWAALREALNIVYTPARRSL